MTPADRIAQLEAELAEANERSDRYEDALRLSVGPVAWGQMTKERDAALKELSDLRQSYADLVLEYSACEDKRGEAIKRAEEVEQERDEANRRAVALIDRHAAELAKAREAGVDYVAVREALRDYQDADITFGRLVEVMRLAVVVVAEKQNAELREECVTLTGSVCDLSCQREAALRRAEEAEKSLHDHTCDADCPVQTLAALNAKLVEALTNMKWVSNHACVTGDCPHDTEAGCAAALREELERIAEEATTALDAAGKADTQ